MNILVTGGAGYIGSICVEELIRGGHNVVVIDNLKEGHPKAVLPEATLYEGDIGDESLVGELLQNHAIEVVMHFAAETLVQTSMTDPHVYFETNLSKGLALLNVMRKWGRNKMIFSSTAAIFGTPKYLPIDEQHPKCPINSYGDSKLMFEKILDWYHFAYGFQFNAFRYFNAAGASYLLGEAHKRETHLIPIVIGAALGMRDGLQIYGSDYQTKDGTCVRDYVHVVDIAQAHILALKNLRKRPIAKYNLGSEIGFTNLEVLRTVERIAGRSIKYELSSRRPGDPHSLVASARLAEKELGWRPRYTSPEAIVRSAWEWHVRNPRGYTE
jgi:UDP-glucose 4-epimerase